MPKRTKQSPSSSTAETSVASETPVHQLHEASVSASSLIVYMAMAKAMGDYYTQIIPLLKHADKYVVNQVNDAYKRLYITYGAAFESEVIAYTASELMAIMNEMSSDITKLLENDAEGEA